MHPSLELFHTPEKGSGYKIRSGCSIKKGELLLREHSHAEAICDTSPHSAPFELAARLRKEYPQHLDILVGDTDLARIDTNAWSRRWLSEGRKRVNLVEIGFIISKFNHSCSPNSDRIGTMEGDIKCSNPSCHPDRRCPTHFHIFAELTAIADIPEGEEVTVSYLHESKLLRLTKEERQRVILTTWNFHCSCPLCQKGENTGKPASISSSSPTPKKEIHPSKHFFEATTFEKKETEARSPPPSSFAPLHV